MENGEWSCGSHDDFICRDQPQLTNYLRHEYKSEFSREKKLVINEGFSRKEFIDSASTVSLNKKIASEIPIPHSPGN